MNENGNNGNREHWSGSLGFVLAAAGSAIGLGNIWKFPYITGQNGGGAFVLIYLICIAIIGIPVMICEITLGRNTQRNPVGAFKAVSPGSSKIAHLLGFGMLLVGVSLICFGSFGWGILFLIIGTLIFIFGWTMAGIMGVVAGFVILSYYSVVAGWTIGYMVKSTNGSISTSPKKQNSEVLAKCLLPKIKKPLTDKEKQAIEKRVAADKELTTAEEKEKAEKQLLETESQKNVLSLINKEYKTKISLPDKPMDSGEFEDFFAEKVGANVKRESLLENVIEQYGGMETVTSKGAKKKQIHPRKLQTKIAEVNFMSFSKDPSTAVAFHIVFMILCVAIVWFGVKGGIEKASKVLMPLLFLLLIILILRGLTLENATKGISFYLTPDFRKINTNSVLIALGHAFFSLSLGMGAMITYGSYISKDENIFLASLSIVGLDTLVALMAGLAIFPAVFAMGFDPSGGVGLVFMVLPAVFHEMPGGPFWALLFFLLLAVAALTSGISLLEVVVAYCIDELKWSRKKAVLIAGFVIAVLGCLCAISVFDWKALPRIKELLDLVFGTDKDSFFGVMDNISSNWLLPLGGLLISIFVGWVWGTRRAVEEIREGSHNFADVHLVTLLAGLKDDPSHNDKTHAWTLASVWGIFIRFISPTAVMIAFLHTIGWIKFEKPAPPPAPKKVEEKAEKPVKKVAQPEKKAEEANNSVTEEKKTKTNRS